MSAAEERGGEGLSVCLVSEEFPPETGWGGIGTYAWNLARGLTDLGHRVHVIARGWGEDSVHEIDGVRVHRVSVPEPSWRRGTYYLNLRFPATREIVLWNLRVNRLVRQIAAVDGLDVLEAPEYHAQGLLAALRQRRVPLVVKLHTPAFLCRQINGIGQGGSRWDTLVSERLEYYLARRARLLTSPSRNLAEQVAARWGMDPAAIRVIPNPIDEELFRPDAAAAPEEDLVLYVGRVERRKGVESLAEALPRIRTVRPPARLRLVGQDHPSGPDGMSMKEHLRRRLREAGVPEAAVEFRGAVERAALPPIYRSAAVCVAPSLYENFPYTCLEAMACGCAVVASAVGGIPEMITDGVDGLLVSPGRPQALAAAVVRLLEEPALRGRLGARARQTVCARFNRAVISAATAAAYRRVLRRSRPACLRGTR